MGHDLKDLIGSKQYSESTEYDVPRVEGKIDGKEIRQKPGFYPYVGSIAIRGENMVVNLSADNYDFHRLDRDYWSGTYTLIEKSRIENHAGGAWLRPASWRAETSLLTVNGFERIVATCRETSSRRSSSPTRPLVTITGRW